MNTVKKYYVALLCILFLAACSKNETDDLVIDNSIELNDLGLESVEKEDLPAKVAEQLRLSNESFDTYLDGSLQFVSHKVLGRATADESLKNAIGMSTRDESILSVGNLAAPETIAIGTLKKVQGTSDKNRKAIVGEMARSAVKKGDLVFELSWNYNGQILKTVALGNEDGITWDNMLFGMVIIEEAQKLKKDGAKTIGETGRYTSWAEDGYEWILRNTWRLRLGEMGYRIRVNYDIDTRQVLTADMSDWARLNFGTAISESEILTVGQTYAQGRYALGVATAGGSISFEQSGFKVTSNYGGTAVRNGSQTVFVRSRGY